MIKLVAALIHEARPLIEGYRLMPLKGGHPYPIYANDQLTVIISGIGSLASAAATGYLHALCFKNGPSAWLNFGLAGHSDFDIGQGFTAHRIVDQGTGQCYYPPRIHPFPCPSSALTTVPRPEQAYKAQGGYDMEASGFYQSALRASTLELIACYKVVSDNPEHPLEKMTKASVIRLMSSGIEDMKALCSILLEAVSAYRKIYASDQALNHILGRWHFTDTQTKQLFCLLQRWRALHGESPLSQVDLRDYPHAKAFLMAMKERLDAHRLLI